MTGMEDRQPMFRIVKRDANGKLIDPWPEAPYIPKPPLSSLRKAGPLPPEVAAGPPEGGVSDPAAVAAAVNGPLTGQTVPPGVSAPASGSSAPAAKPGAAPKAAPSKTKKLPT